MPTNTMLSISEKKTDFVDLCRALREYITFNYSGREAENLDNDLRALKDLRSHLEDPAKQPAPLARRDILQSYFRALCVIETHFPISSAKDHIHVTFTWHDAFEKILLKVRKVRKKASQQNIHLEKAAVLFNLGAVYNEIGRSYDRSTVEGRKRAVRAFMDAAGAFAYLKDNAAAKASMGRSTTIDVSMECATMLERLMLAQAQECVFENTMANGGSSSGLGAKISRQVGLYYEEASAALEAPPLEGRVDKDWISRVQLKAALFNAEAYYRYGLELHEKYEIGEEIARLKRGISILEVAKKSSKGGPTELFKAIEKLEANIKTNLGTAVRENSTIYHMTVPSPDSLPSLPSLSMVKPTQMNEVLDARREKLFSSLAPLVPVGLESDVYGQSASNLVAGSNLEGVIQKILELGGGRWDRDTAVRALAAGHNDLGRAVDYLLLDIPEQQAASPPAQRAQPAQSAPGQLSSAMPPEVTVTPKDREAIQKLVEMGFPRTIALDVYFACNKDEVLALDRLADLMCE